MIKKSKKSSPKKALEKKELLKQERSFNGDSLLWAKPKKHFLLSNTTGLLGVVSLKNTIQKDFLIILTGKHADGLP